MLVFMSICIAQERLLGHITSTVTVVQDFLELVLLLLRHVVVDVATDGVEAVV
jgi:hypothetical protein|tara:strand:+ start:654 stop:812 length:159 start_codon:yes stop_codon:yes gene_type:complete